MKVIPVRHPTDFLGIAVLIFCFSAVAYPPCAFAGLPPQGKQAWDLMEGPSKRYEDPSQEGDLFALMNRSEIVFTGKIQSIYQPNAGLMPVPLIKIKFDNVYEYKGRLPVDKSFRYPFPITTLQFKEGAEVIAILRRSDTKNYEIVKLIRMTKANLSLVKTVQTQSQPSEATNSRGLKTK